MSSQSRHLQDESVELQDLASAIDARYAHQCQESQREREEENRTDSTMDAMLYTFKVLVSCPSLTSPRKKKKNATNMFVAVDFHASYF